MWSQYVQVQAEVGEWGRDEEAEHNLDGGEPVRRLHLGLSLLTAVVVVVASEGGDGEVSW